MKINEPWKPWSELPPPVVGGTTEFFDIVVKFYVPKKDKMDVERIPDCYIYQESEKHDPVLMDGCLHMPVNLKRYCPVAWMNRITLPDPNEN